MKTFKNFLAEAKNKKKKKIHKFFAHYRSGKDKNHDPFSKESESKVCEGLKEDFALKHNKASLEELNDNISSLVPHAKLMSKEIREDPSGNHQLEVQNFTRNSKYLNKSLIENKDIDSSGLRKHITVLDQITTNPKNALKKPIKTYSGLGTSIAHVLSKTKVGDHVESPCYISTSLDHDVARKFSSLIRESESNDHITYNAHYIQFHLPKGYSKGRYIANKFRVNADEHEVVLARGQKFKKIGENQLTENYRYETINRIIHHLEPVED